MTTFSSIRSDRNELDAAFTRCQSVHNQDLEAGIETAFHTQVEPGRQEGLEIAPLTTKTQIHPKLITDSFYFLKTQALGNAHPCKLKFGKKEYLSAEACFLAQQYLDQPKIMWLFAKFKTLSDARWLARQFPMTKEHEAVWENPKARDSKNAVMKRVLKRKFEQNFNLKQMLLNTGNEYLACQDDDPFWGSGFAGTGRNILGINLMRLRGTFGGTGIVPPTPSYFNKALETLEKRCQPFVFGVPTEIVQTIFIQCLSMGDLLGAMQFSSTNVHCYISMRKLVNNGDLEQLCPGLTFVNLKIGDAQVDDLPPIDKPKTFKRYWQVSPHVENNAGLTAFAVPSDLKYKMLDGALKGVEISLDATRRSPVKSPDRGVKKSYWTMVTNGPVIGARGASRLDQARCVYQAGFDRIPTMDEYLLLAVFSKSAFKSEKCAYQVEDFVLTSQSIDNLSFGMYRNEANALSAFNIKEFNYFCAYRLNDDDFKELRKRVCSGGQIKV